MPHPHKKAIENMSPSSLVGIIEESKVTYVRENLSVFLHESQIKLLKQVKKHEKPHHKRIRIRQYEKADKNDLFKGAERDPARTIKICINSGIRSRSCLAGSRTGGE